MKNYSHDLILESIIKDSALNLLLSFNQTHSESESESVHNPY